MNNASPTFSPLYRQIKKLILQSLQAGEWRPAEAIPSEIELAARFKVSQGTVRKAIDELSAEHLLVRRQGKGTFVATHSEARAQFRFLRLMPLEGEQEYPPSTLLECRRTRAGAETARYLEMKAGESLVFLRRLLFFKGEPTVIDEISLPGSIFKGLSAAKFNEYKGSMYNLFETEFGTRMLRAEERISALAADADAAKLLEVAPGTPLLCVDRVSFTYGDKPVEVRRGLYRTDRHYYKNVLS
ncbi:MAG: GntR family transcriptional regulator [Betaproteobacteria bacterium]